MTIFPQTLSLITTHRCTSSCDHCCFNCGPDVHDQIPVENLHKYLDQAAEVPSLKVVVFTGGECFLLGRDLDDLVKHATETNLKTRFVSNGYWASSIENAQKRLQPLFDNGLTETNFSTGDMHSRYVKPEYVRNGAIAAARGGRLAVIMVEMFKESTFDLAAFTDHLEFKKWIDEKRVIITPSVWMPFSGQADIKYSDAFLKTMNDGANCGCSSLFNVIAINPDQDLIACCGLTNAQIPEMHLGNLRTQSIRKILQSSQDDLIKIWIHLEGPKALINYAKKVDPSITAPVYFGHLCHACRYVYQNEKIRKAIAECPPDFANELTERFFTGMLIANSPAVESVHEQRKKRLEAYLDNASLKSAENLLALMAS